MCLMQRLKPNVQPLFDGVLHQNRRSLSYRIVAGSHIEDTGDGIIRLDSSDIGSRGVFNAQDRPPEWLDC